MSSVLSWRVCVYSEDRRSTAARTARSAHVVYILAKCSTDHMFPTIALLTLFSTTEARHIRHILPRKMVTVFAGRDLSLDGFIGKTAPSSVLTVSSINHTAWLEHGLFCHQCQSCGENSKERSKEARMVPYKRDVL